MQLTPPEEIEMPIKKAIDNYLAAVERVYGEPAKAATKLKHVDGVNFVLRKHTDNQPHVVDIHDLSLLTQRLESAKPVI